MAAMAVRMMRMMMVAMAMRMMRLMMAATVMSMSLKIFYTMVALLVMMKITMSRRTMGSRSRRRKRWHNSFGRWLNMIPMSERASTQRSIRIRRTKQAMASDDDDDDDGGHSARDDDSRSREAAGAEDDAHDDETHGCLRDSFVL